MTTSEPIDLAAFLDANVILECRPLDELPWHELGTEGTFLAVVTPTAMREIDAKKRDGRLGKIARRFNQLVEPLALGGPPIVIRDTTPRVLLALSTTGPVDWNNQQDLDPDEPDHRIVVEALNAKLISDIPRILISHDIQPLAAATRVGLKAVRVSDDWLRPAEPSAKDRQIQRLQHQLRTYEKGEPVFDFDFQFDEAVPLRLVKLRALTNTERQEIEDRIVRLNPRKSQDDTSAFSIRSHLDFDSSYDERYRKWLTTKLPAFVETYEHRISMMHNQVYFTLSITNKGEVQANSLRIDISVNHGWFNKRPVWISPRGPACPVPRSFDHHLQSFRGLDDIIRNTPRHDFVLDPAPSRSRQFAALCEDFRHGHCWTFEGVLGLDVDEASPTVIEVAATASNYHGTARMEKVIDWGIEEVPFEDLIDQNHMRLKRKTIVHPIIEAGNTDEIDMGHEDDT